MCGIINNAILEWKAWWAWIHWTIFFWLFLLFIYLFIFCSYLSNMGNKKGNTTRLKSVWFQWTYFQNMFQRYQWLELLSAAEKANCIWIICTALARLAKVWMTARSIGSTLNNVHSNYFSKQKWQKPSLDVTKKH